jgi:putative flippase GtrA
MNAPATGFLDRLRQLTRDRAFMVKAASFACVGVVNTLIDFGVFSLTHLYFGLPIVVANAISWTVAVTGSYVMNSQITFAAESQRKLSVKAYLGFIAAQIAGFIANTVTVVVASYFMPVLVGKALAIGASFVVNFSLSHFFVFRPGINPDKLR